MVYNSGKNEQNNGNTYEMFEPPPSLKSINVNKASLGKHEPIIQSTLL